MPFELPNGAPCLFCEVIDGREDKGIVEETDLTLTFVNWRQFERGQVYVIPRRHAPTLLDLTDEEAHAITAAVRRIADALVATFDPDGMTLYQNNGVASGQGGASFPYARGTSAKDEQVGRGATAHRGPREPG